MAVAGLLAPADIAAQECARDAQPGRLSGTVWDTAGAPVIGAHILLAACGLSTVTDQKGTFDFANVRSGRHALDVRRLGYRPKSLEIGVSADTAIRITIDLVPVPLELRAVAATAPRGDFARTGFSVRRQRGIGAFFDRADLDRHSARALSDLFRSLPGFHVQPSYGRWGYQNTATMDRTRTGSRPCDMNYYVNGHEYAPTSVGIDRDVPLAQIEAIEVYRPSEAPPEFLGSRARCGVVLIWTRYRAHEVER